LEWLGKDRASAKFHGTKDVKDKRSDLDKIVRAWIEHV
jgi:hypothetical protein